MKQKFHAFNKKELIIGFNWAIPPSNYFESLETDVILHLKSGKTIVYNLIYNGSFMTLDKFIKSIKSSIASIRRCKAEVFE